MLDSTEKKERKGTMNSTVRTIFIPVFLPLIKSYLPLLLLLFFPIILTLLHFQRIYWVSLKRTLRICEINFME
jgi:hypothetical protein